MSSNLATLTAGLTPEQLFALQNENHDVEVYTCAAVFSALAILAVIMRVTSRHMKKVAFGVDDVLILLAMVLAFPCSDTDIVAVNDSGANKSFDV